MGKVILPEYLKQSDRQIQEKFRYIQHQEDGRLRDATLDPENSRWSFGVSVLEENDRRNRYVNIMPFERNRVRLKVEEGNDYINASYVKVDVPQQSISPGIYIATQGPTNKTWDQFWQMCYQTCPDENIVIVMVTPLVEHGREKCYQYWPIGGQLDSAREISKIQKPGGSADISVFPTSLRVSFIESERFSQGYTLSTLKLEPTDEYMGPSKTVHHFYFDQWEDMNKPEEVIPIMKLSEHSHRLNSGKNPIIVHCSAGVGRSGTFISLDYLIHNTLDFQSHPDDHLSLSPQFRPSQDYHHDLIEQIVQQLRSQRLKMVQIVDQYRFIYLAAKCLYQKSRKEQR
ncbi:hypothetical protein Kpol_1054p34 [Vanderwaltozyma polyspora DSM 70294]|uniref:protein-tyrosine-phosphatase n=1 Tax=Vanderwaltozyma polyspora (strain ATCC 22028 / DSM 70294 / BCRC 21397 / CBS 2163 / NBRC 10782 / NRRL Y-8283 / UCD 57-17) TaxID=436907 RepID=A7TIC1_VANPO|nr:uncharacterized protein Kpol_1054p34 [Vanderwaltozyma polyspora DSM 70294]EDO17987.1 hypothetical protein Kpol_1054p34 [Vanderwaltozyma polyspora DSM 70294]